MLVPCRQCQRHLKDTETRCPFCAIAAPLGGAAALLSAALVLGACGEPKPPTPPAEPVPSATPTSPTSPTNPIASATTTATTTAPTAAPTPPAPQPDRQAAPRYGMPPQRVDPPTPSK